MAARRPYGVGHVPGREIRAADIPGLALAYEVVERTEKRLSKTPEKFGTGMKGLVPGPFLFRDHAELVWGVIASLYIGNVILLVLNLPLIPLWVKLLKIPGSILYTFVLAFCAIGAYSINGRVFDIAMMTLFGVLGYLFKKIDIPLAPMILTLILGPVMEQSLRQSLEMSRGKFSIFVEHPISLGLIIVALVFAVGSTMRGVAKKRGADSEV